MPGSSLWLIPPPSSPFSQEIQTLITTRIPSHFSSSRTHNFTPHITLTSSIPSSLHSNSSSDPDGHAAQAWLDSLALTSLKAMTCTLETLEPGKPFFKKLTLRIRSDAGLLELAAQCRAAGVADGDEEVARRWAKEEYAPHLSLMYAEMDVSVVEAQAEAIEKDLKEVRNSLAAAGAVSAGDIVARGGSVVLVPTDKPITDWEPIARRELPSLQWVWS